MERLHRRLSTEFRLQQFSDWQAKFSAVVADLLAATDPECSATYNSSLLIVIGAVSLTTDCEETG